MARPIETRSGTDSEGKEVKKHRHAWVLSLNKKICCCLKCRETKPSVSGLCN